MLRPIIPPAKRIRPDEHDPMGAARTIPSKASKTARTTKAAAAITIELEIDLSTATGKVMKEAFTAILKENAEASQALATVIEDKAGGNQGVLRKAVSAFLLSGGSFVSAQVLLESVETARDSVMPMSPRPVVKEVKPEAPKIKLADEDALRAQARREGKPMIGG